MGLTHEQIAEKVSLDRGYPVSRSTVSSALHRAGESSQSKKYPDEIPWVVREKHQTHYAPRMLRLLGRRNKGVANSADMDARLDAWLRQLREAGAVVVYVPETADGFFYVEGEPDNNKGIPIDRNFSLDPKNHATDETFGRV